MTADQLQTMRDLFRRVSMLVHEADALGRRLELEKDPAAQTMRETHAYLQGAEQELAFGIKMSKGTEP